MHTIGGVEKVQALVKLEPDGPEFIGEVELMKRINPISRKATYVGLLSVTGGPADKRDGLYSVKIEGTDHSLKAHRRIGQWFASTS